MTTATKSRKKKAAAATDTLDLSNGILKACQAWFAEHPNVTRDEAVTALTAAGISKGTASVQFYRARKNWVSA